MRLTDKQEEKLKLESETEEMILQLFKIKFDKDTYLNSIWEWPLWIKTLGDARKYHAHRMFRMLQQAILKAEKWSLANEDIYVYLQNIFSEEYPEINMNTGEIIIRKEENADKGESKRGNPECL